MYLPNNYQEEQNQKLPRNKALQNFVGRVILSILLTHSAMIYYLGSHNGFMDGFAIFGPIMLPFIFMVFLYITNHLLKKRIEKNMTTISVQNIFLAIVIIALVMLSSSIFVGAYAPWIEIRDPSWGGKSLSYSFRLHSNVGLWSFISFLASWLLIVICNLQKTNLRTSKYFYWGLITILCTIALLYCANKLPQIPFQG